MLTSLEDDFAGIFRSTVKEVERRKALLAHDKSKIWFKMWFIRDAEEIAMIKDFLGYVTTWKEFAGTALLECTGTRDAARSIRQSIERIAPQLERARE